MGDNTPEGLNTASVNIILVNQERFFAEEDSLLEDGDNYRNVPTSTWIETTMDIPIVNVGAGPCLIIYIFDRENNRVLSGHFPETSEERQKDILRDRVKTKQFQFNDPEAKTVKIYSERDIPDQKTIYDRCYEEYQSLLKRTAEILSDSKDQLEIHLFG